MEQVPRFMAKELGFGVYGFGVLEFQGTGYRDEGVGL